MFKHVCATRGTGRLISRAKPIKNRVRDKRVRWPGNNNQLKAIGERMANCFGLGRRGQKATQNSKTTQP